jgi:hypothetical protein
LKKLIVFFLFLTSVTSLFAAPPPVSDAGKKEAQSDPDVIKDDVEKMKEDVINRKAQMLLFKQLIKNEGIEATSPIVSINHVNDMSSRYKIFSLAYSIDNDRIYSYYLEDNLGKANILSHETQVFKGPIIAGTHQLTVDVVYKGNDSGVFSYINEYKIPIESKQSFQVDKGQNLDIQVVGFEKGWALTDFKDRPQIKIKFNGSNTAKALK